MRVRCTMAVVVVALAACGSSSATSTGTRVSATCAPRGAHALAADRRAIVYASGGHVYGCANATRRRYLLGAGARTLREGRVGPVVLAGVDAAYGLTRFGVDTGSTQVVVRRLTDGTVLHSAPATSSSAGAESFQAVAALVSKPDGAVAWIGQSSSIVGHGRRVELHRIDSRGQAKLDTGPGIVSDSLRLRRSRLTWTNSGRRRSATLS